MDNIKQYDTSGNQSEHGCFVLYTDYLKALQEMYRKGVDDGINSVRQTLVKL